jgi:hypothetical protein
MLIIVICCMLGYHINAVGWACDLSPLPHDMGYFTLDHCLIQIVDINVRIL